MVIDRPEAIDAAPARRPKRSGGWQPGDFVVSRGMPAKPAGEESRSAPLRHRRSRRSRRSARSAHRRGRLERSIRQRCIEENMARPVAFPAGPARLARHSVSASGGRKRDRRPAAQTKDASGIRHRGAERTSSQTGLRFPKGFDVGRSGLVEARSVASSCQQTTRTANESRVGSPLRCSVLKRARFRLAPRAWARPTSSRERMP